MGPKGRFAHAIVAGPVGVHIGNRAGGTGLRTLWITAAQVALDDLAGILIVIDGAKGTSDGAYLTANTDILVDFFRPGRQIDGNRLHRTGVHAPCLITLRASVGNGGAPVFELEDFNARFGRIEHALVFEGTRHFAL